MVYGEQIYDLMNLPMNEFKMTIRKPLNLIS